MNTFLDDAIRKISHPDTVKGVAGLETARRMIAPLADLPDETDPTVIAQHLVALSSHAQADHIRSALFERIRDHHATRAETIALILHATDARLAEIVPGDGPTMVLNLLSEDPGLIALFARRLTAALSEDADLWGKSPSVDYLTDLAARFDNSEAEAPLRDLIQATNAAQPEDGLA